MQLGRPRRDALLGVLPAAGARTRQEEATMSRERELTLDDRARWGDCPVCQAKDGEYCHADVGVQMGQHVDGSRMKDGEGAHLARLQKAPSVVREVAVR